jgi:nicotinate-nucleotide adenylyltransferase
LNPGLRRLGVFGGAFDPPHAAHLALADAALEQLRLDELRVIPTGQAWHKARSLSAPEHRLAMTRLAFADRAAVVVDPRETLRGGPSYTVDTLHELQAEHPGCRLFLVIGQDQAVALTSWRSWEEVVRLATICVAARPGFPAPASTQAAAAPVPAGFLPLDFPQQSVSATDIRQRIAHGQGVAPLVAPAVARYIAKHHLYRST